MSDTETPKQWADRIYRHCRTYRPDAENARRTLNELAAVKRKADAADLWRAEALTAFCRVGSTNTKASHGPS